jgi:hypothetical protein
MTPEQPGVRRRPGTLDVLLMADQVDPPRVRRTDDGIEIRRGDGSIQSIPNADLRKPSTEAICCFCGTSVEYSDIEYTSLSVRWTEDGRERRQQWGAHHRCVAERMHERVSGTGPFFGD